MTNPLLTAEQYIKKYGVEALEKAEKALDISLTRRAANHWREVIKIVKSQKTTIN